MRRDKIITLRISSKLDLRFKSFLKSITTYSLEYQNILNEYEVYNRNSFTYADILEKALEDFLKNHTA